MTGKEQQQQEEEEEEEVGKNSNFLTAAMQQIKII